VRDTTFLTLRQHRLGFSLVFGATGVVLLAAIVFAALLQLSDVKSCLDPSLVVAAEAWTESQIAAYQARCEVASAVVVAMSGVIFLGGNVLPVGAAVFLAAPLVAQEVETTTATLSWTLARSRRAWYLPRAAMVMGACVGTALALGLLVDWSLGVLQPGFAPFESLREVYLRGLLIPSRVALTAASCLFVGSLLGRQVPALVIGIALAASLGLGLYALDDSINRDNARRLAGEGMTFDWVVFDRSSGEVVPPEVSWADANSYPGVPEWDARYEEGTRGIPDSDAPVVIWRNVALHVGVTIVLLFASAVRVSRRRPY
jgi:hypothetical protein